MLEISKLSWEKKVDAVHASYNRIDDRAGLAREFYNYFFKLNPKIKEYFKNTDFDHQEKLFLNGLKYLLDFLDGTNANARTQVLRLSQSHSIYGLKVHPHHYFYWTEALIHTIREFDPYWQDELENYWREVIHFPISFMISQYFNKVE